MLPVLLEDSLTLCWFFRGIRGRTGACKGLVHRSHVIKQYSSISASDSGTNRVSISSGGFPVSPRLRLLPTSTYLGTAVPEDEDNVRYIVVHIFSSVAASYRNRNVKPVVSSDSRKPATLLLPSPLRKGAYVNALKYCRSMYLPLGFEGKYVLLRGTTAPSCVVEKLMWRLFRRGPFVDIKMTVSSIYLPLRRRL